MGSILQVGKKPQNIPLYPHREYNLSKPKILQKGLEDKLSRIPDEDEDIKDEIRKGNTVTIIGDSFDY